MRAFLYWLAKLLGDIGSVQKGKAGRRAKRRVTGRIFSRWLK
jgi:hypothetical protein